MAKTAIVYREETLAHDTGLGHPERPDRLRAVMRGFSEASLDPPRLEVKPARREDLLRVHTAKHVDAVETACATSAVYPDPDTVMGAGSWDAALLACGGILSACEAVLDGTADRVFCVTRPPGHHAERGRAMGFCLFNHVAVAARWLQSVRGVERVAILDWDVHHGNGTQDATLDDPSIYYASIHQHPHYPGTGFPSERGAHDTNLNIQMSPGCGPEDWLEALDRTVLPELERFKPDFLLLSCGFDAHHRDPLGAQELCSETFAEMTRRVLHLADGRIVSQLEGGYHLDALAESALAHFNALGED